MGSISKYAQKYASGFQPTPLIGNTPQFPQRERAAQTWRQIFGSGGDEHPPYPKSPRGGYGDRTTDRNGGYLESATAKNSKQMLLRALRSMAPGGWSDDRWEQTRHEVGVSYVAINTICRQLSRAEFTVYRADPRVPEGKRPVSSLDPPEGGRLVPPYRLVELLNKPNRQDTFGLLMWRIVQQRLLTGTALSWGVPSELGKRVGTHIPCELYVIPTATAIPQPAVNPLYPDGYYRIQPYYPYGPFSSYPTPASAVGAPIPANEMIKSLYPHPLLRYEGYSPLTAMRLEIDEFEMIGRSRHYKMRRTVAPTASLDMTGMEGAEPLDEAEIERMKVEFENTLMGPENAGRLFMPPPGCKLDEYGAHPKEMDYPQSWSQLADFILGGGFGITKPAAGMTEASTYSTLWACLKQLYWLTLDPECEMIAGDFTRQLAPFFGDDLIIEIRPRRLDDQEVRSAKLTMLMGAKAIKKNEMRKELEFPTTQEPWGNDIAGDPSPFEKQAATGMPPGLSGAPTPGGLSEALGAMAPEGGAGSGEEPGGAAAPPPAPTPEGMEPSRPTPGKLSMGAGVPHGRRTPSGMGKSLPSWKKRILARAKCLTPLEEAEVEPEEEPTPRRSLVEMLNERIGNGHH